MDLDYAIVASHANAVIPCAFNGSAIVRLKLRDALLVRPAQFERGELNYQTFGSLLPFFAAALRNIAVSSASVMLPIPFGFAGSGTITNGFFNGAQGSFIRFSSRNLFSSFISSRTIRVSGQIVKPTKPHACGLSLLSPRPSVLGE